MKDKLPKKLRKQFLTFIQAHPPRKFSNAMRRMLLDYLAREVNIGLHIEFDEFLFGLYDFFELMDAAEEYQKKATIKKTAEK
jgi:hypothetical protein